MGHCPAALDCLVRHAHVRREAFHSCAPLRALSLSEHRGQGVGLGVLSRSCRPGDPPSNDSISVPSCSPGLVRSGIFLHQHCSRVAGFCHRPSRHGRALHVSALYRPLPCPRVVPGSTSGPEAGRGAREAPCGGVSAPAVAALPVPDLDALRRMAERRDPLERHDSEASRGCIPLQQPGRHQGVEGRSRGGGCGLLACDRVARQIPKCIYQSRHCVHQDARI